MVADIEAIAYSPVDYTAAEQAFLSRYPEYKTTKVLDDTRNTEYRRLDEQGHIYLDYTGGNLFAASQVQQHAALLLSQVFGNPHSTNPTSRLSSQLIDEARQTIIDHFKAYDYHLVFTANASQALKIIGEGYPFEDNGHFLLLFDNHNSVNGIREYSRMKGAAHTYSPVNIEDLRINEPMLQQYLAAHPDKENKLFAMPAQSNVSGVKHNLKWVKEAQQLGWDVLLDAAAYVPSNVLDLSDVQPEFVSMSFYKIFGYPTGLGALLIKKSVFNKLHKNWFAGGTVKFVSVSSDNFFLAENYERFEDGTLNYLGIPALTIGFHFINRIGMDTINRRVTLLTAWLLEQMLTLKHNNGEPLVHVFGPKDSTERGGTIIFNVFGNDGKPLPYLEVEAAANAANISLRTGCFCNPGIDEINNCISSEELAGYFTSHSGGDFADMIHSLGRMRGAIRISVGLASNFADAYKFINFLKRYLQ
jgi:molybdenum cofactor sulfurtransferase